MARITALTFAFALTLTASTASAWEPQRGPAPRQPVCSYVNGVLICL